MNQYNIELHILPSFLKADSNSSNSSLRDEDEDTPVQVKDGKFVDVSQARKGAFDFFNEKLGKTSWKVIKEPKSKKLRVRISKAVDDSAIWCVKTEYEIPLPLKVFQKM
jgi:hypothetical protein